MHGTPGRGAPIAFAHRGARAERRENTIEAFARALELGATGLESDAWITADGVAVLDHDGVTGPLWHRRRIRDVPRAQLPGHIPALSELFDSCGSGFELSLDVKDSAAFAEVVRVARSAGGADRLWLCHPDERLLARWRNEAPEARLVHSTGPAVTVRTVRGERTWGPYLESVGRGIDAVNMRGREWNRLGVGSVHQASLLVLAWDAQSERDISRLLDLEVDGLFSDHPEIAVPAVRARFGPSDPA